MELDTYNIIQDGEIRYVNGNNIFVPWMQGTEDELYKEYLKEILKINWGNYKLYLVGGLLQGWKTTDIDICVTGTIGDDLPGLMEKAHAVGPIDIYYVKSLDEIKGNTSRIWEFAKSRDRVSNETPRFQGQWKLDGLFWMSEKFDPKGREYTKEPLKLN